MYAKVLEGLLIVLVIMAIAFMVCGVAIITGKPAEAQGFDSRGHLHSREHEGHRYVVATFNSGVSVIHSPACKCQSAVERGL